MNKQKKLRRRLVSLQTCAGEKQERLVPFFLPLLIRNLAFFQLGFSFNPQWFYLSTSDATITILSAASEFLIFSYTTKTQSLTQCFCLASYLNILLHLNLDKTNNFSVGCNNEVVVFLVSLISVRRVKTELRISQRKRVEPNKFDLVHICFCTVVVKMFHLRCFLFFSCLFQVNKQI